MKTFLYDQGTRIRIRGGHLPMDPMLVGREGMILELESYHPGRYGVVLDGEDRVRAFEEEELEVIDEPDRPAGDTGPGVGPRALVDQ